MTRLLLFLFVVPSLCYLRPGGRPGGRNSVNVNSVNIQEMASVAVSELSNLLGTENTLVRVIEAHTQVVSGLNYFLKLEVKEGDQTKICDVTIWSRSWLNENKLTEHQCSSQSSSFTRRSFGLLGGFSDANMRDPEISDIASFALREINADDNGQRTLEEVVSAQQQVVAGTNYRLTILVSENGQNERCNIEVYESLEGDKSLTSYSCNSVYCKKW